MDPSDPKTPPQNPSTDPLSPNTGQTPIPTPSDSQAPPNAWSPIEQPQSGGPQPALTPDGAGPILPGQFVITGEDTPTQSQNTQPDPVPSSMPPPAPAPELNTSQNSDPINQSINNLTAQDQLITPPSNPLSANSDPLPLSQNPATSTSQPDPTPFIPPGQASSQGGFSKPPGGIKKLRSIILVLGIIILMMIAGAIAWFFFFGNQENQAAKTENQSPSEPAIEQAPIPKRGDGGFDQIQEDSTPSGQLQATPAASTVPTP